MSELVPDRDVRGHTEAVRLSSLKPREEDLVVARDQGEAGSALGMPPGPEVLAGKYSVESRIGAGGMGVVLLATDLETGRPMALKRVHASLAGRKQVVERLLRGARVARSFSGKYIARVLDSGLLLPGSPATPDVGVPFVVTDYLEGCDFVGYLKRRGPLGVKEAVKYLLQICEAVAEGHAAGILHRDLKPENLFLCLASEGGPSVKVLDFGISAVACGVESDVQSSVSGAMRSSLLYMAPEQMRSAGGIDERTDIWSIGAVGYTLVCGAGPFEARTEIEICSKVLGEPPAPIPAGIALGGLERVLLRCLDKEPEQRFANVSELALALARYGGDGAQSTAERVWELLMSDETVRMEIPIPDGMAPDSAQTESAPDTVPVLPQLWPESPEPFKAAQDTPFAPDSTMRSEDTLVSRYPDTPPPAAGRRRSSGPIPQVVLMAAPEQQRQEVMTERRPRGQTGAAIGADHALS
jgi:eukaryotic-like serine/threonine-protein kinase